jgi:hypothetical protein
MVGGLVMGALDKLYHQPSLGASVLPAVCTSFVSVHHNGYTKTASSR